MQETVRGEAEVIVGIRRDEQFGPIVMVGLGGIAIEILNDVAVATAPVTAARVRAHDRGVAHRAALRRGARPSAARRGRDRRPQRSA